MCDVCRGCDTMQHDAHFQVGYLLAALKPGNSAALRQKAVDSVEQALQDHANHLCAVAPETKAKPVELGGVAGYPTRKPCREAPDEYAYPCKAHAAFPIEAPEKGKVA